MKLRLICASILMYTLSAHSAELTKQEVSVTITAEGKHFLCKNVYEKLLTVSGTLQNDHQEYITANAVYFPDIQDPYYEIGHDSQCLQYITDYISTDNTHAYLNTLSLVQLIHLYQNADYWSLSTPILDTLQTQLVGKLQNKDVLNNIFSTRTSLDTFLNACNAQTKATLAHTLLPHVRSLFWPLVTEPYQTLTDHTDWIRSLTVHPEGTLFSGSDDHTICVWKINGQGIYYCAQILDCHTDWIRSLAVHADGTLFSGSDDYTIRVWKKDAQVKYKCMHTLTGHTQPVNTVAVHPDSTLFSGSYDKTIRVWKINGQGIYYCAQTLDGHTNWIHSLAVHTDGTLFSSSKNYTRVWKVPALPPLSLEQCLTVTYLYHQYQNNNKQQLTHVSRQAHNFYNTLPSSVKNIIIPWYNPTPLYKKLIVTGLAASIIGAGCYLYYKWLRK